MTNGKNENWVSAAKCAADMLREAERKREVDVSPFSLRAEKQAEKNPTPTRIASADQIRATDHTSVTHVREDK
jgi:hypothetical protein